MCLELYLNGNAQCPAGIIITFIPLFLCAAAVPPAPPPFPVLASLLLSSYWQHFSVYVISFCMEAMQSVLTCPKDTSPVTQATKASLPAGLLGHWSHIYFLSFWCKIFLKNHILRKSNQYLVAQELLHGLVPIGRSASEGEKSPDIRSPCFLTVVPRRAVVLHTCILRTFWITQVNRAFG